MFIELYRDETFTKEKEHLAQIHKDTSECITFSINKKQHGISIGLPKEGLDLQ